MKKWFIPALFGLCTPALAQNTAPLVTNLTALTDTLNNTVTLNFDLVDGQSDSLEVYLTVSDDMGASYMIQPAGLSGNVGFPQFAGTGKQIVWNYTGFTNPLNQFRLKVVANDRKHVPIQDMADQVDTLRLLHDMSLIEGVRSHTAGAAHLQNVSDTIYNRFSGLGLQTALQSFTYSGISAGNILGKSPGITHEAEVYIIDGHFDGVPAGPAADDNASAVIGVLEAARILSQYTFKKTLRFIAFDLEEAGLRGSAEYVNNGLLPREQVKGVLNFEMIGYYSERNNSQTFPPGFGLLFPAAETAVAADTFKGNFITNVANTASSPLRQKFDQCAAAYVPALRVISIEAPGNSEIAPDLRRSDHAVFWDKGYQALMLTDGANFRNHNYHTANDVSDSLNFEFIANVVKATLATAAELAEPISYGEATVDVTLPDVTSSVQAYPGQAFRIELIPNPADDKLSVRWNTAAKPQTIRLSDASGRIVYQSALSASATQHHIQTGAFPAGMYILSVQGKGWEKSEKLLIQR